MKSPINIFRKKQLTMIRDHLDVFSHFSNQPAIWEQLFLQISQCLPIVWTITISRNHQTLFTLTLTYIKYPKVGHPKIIKLPFVLNLKLIIFGCPKLWAHYSLIIMCSNIGTSKTITFPFGTNGKLMVLGVPILKHFRAYTDLVKSSSHDLCHSRPLRIIFYVLHASHACRSRWKGVVK